METERLRERSIGDSFYAADLNTVDMASNRLGNTYEVDSSLDASYNSSLLEASPSMPPATESSTASSSESPSRYPLPNTPLVVRSNFGKGGGFVPTITPGSQTSPDRGYGSGSSGGEEHYGQRRGVATIQPPHVSPQRPVVAYPMQISRAVSDVSKPFDENVGERQVPYPTRLSRVNSGESKPFDEQIGGSTAAVLNTSKDSTRLNTSTGDDSNEAVLNSARFSARMLNTSTGEDSSQSNQAISAPVSETQNLTDWERSPPRRQPNTSHRSYYSDTNEDDETFGSFRMSPPRLSQPRNVPYHPGSSDRDASDDSRDLSAEAHLGGRSPPRENHSSEANYKEFRRNNNSQEQGQHGTKKEQEGGGDDDSLFDFEEAARLRAKAAEKVNKKLRRGRRSQDEDDEEDDTSLEKDYGAVNPQTNLQERTQAAWKRKSLAARRATSSEISREAQSQNVSFGKGDTVHTFEPTLDGTIGTSVRSLNSEYTKSAESEVEDVIKDIFMIGTSNTTKPGRRKVMYSPTAKYRVNDRAVDRSDDFEDEDTTLDPSTIAEETPKKYSSSSGGRGRGRARRERERPTSRRQRFMDDIDEEKDEDPLAGVWSYMEGGIHAVSSVLGLESVSSESLEMTKAKQKERDAKSNGKEKQGGFKGFMNYYSDVLLGSASNDSSANKTPVDSEVKVNKTKVMKMEEPDDLESPPSLEEDLRLVDLAIQAARSAHRLQGYEFDETYDVNIVTDIKFSVVDLHLPLGLIFQENDGGCWVTKVLPEGSAMKSRSVKVGDQLAAIDGSSAIRLTVDEIAKIIKGKKSVIELTFLRFVGPLRPAAGDIQEEGYEVKAATNKDPPASRDRVKERSRPPKNNKETATKSNSPRAQQSPTKSPTDKTSARAAKSPRNKTSARAVQVKEADTGKRRFRWFGRKKEMEVE